MSKFTRVVVALRWPALLLPLTAAIVAQGINERTADDPAIQISASITTMVTTVLAGILLLSQITNAILVTYRRRESPEPLHSNPAYAAWALLLYLICAAWITALCALSGYELAWTVAALMVPIAGLSRLCWWSIRTIKPDRTQIGEYWRAGGRAIRNNGTQL